MNTVTIVIKAARSAWIEFWHEYRRLRSVRERINDSFIPF